MSIKKGLLIFILIVAVGAASYSSFGFFLYASSEDVGNVRVDRTPALRYFLEASVAWPLAVLFFYLLLKTKKPK